MRAQVTVIRVSLQQALIPTSAQPRCSWMMAILKSVAAGSLKHCWWVVRIVPDFIGKPKGGCCKRTCIHGRQLPEQAARQKHPRELKSSHRDFLRLGHDRAKAHARESARKQNTSVTPQGIRCTAVTISPYSTNHATQRHHVDARCCQKCMSNDSKHTSCTTNQGVADSTPLVVPKRQRKATKSKLFCEYLAPSGRGTCSRARSPHEPTISLLTGSKLRLHRAYTHWSPSKCQEMAGEGQQIHCAHSMRSSG